MLKVFPLTLGANPQAATQDAKNIARLANGSQVSINSVNGGTVGSSGGAPTAANCQAANPAWIQNVSVAEYLGTIDDTELNGNTIILMAQQNGLTPGQTYHIKLLITDVGVAFLAILNANRIQNMDFQ